MFQRSQGMHFCHQTLCVNQVQGTIHLEMVVKASEAWAHFFYLPLRARLILWKATIQHSIVQCPSIIFRNQLHQSPLNRTHRIPNPHFNKSEPIKCHIIPKGTLPSRVTVNMAIASTWSKQLWHYTRLPLVPGSWLQILVWGHFHLLCHLKFNQSCLISRSEVSWNVVFICNYCIFLQSLFAYVNWGYWKHWRQYHITVIKRAGEWGVDQISTRLHSWFLQDTKLRLRKLKFATVTRLTTRLVFK